MMTAVIWLVLSVFFSAQERQAQFGGVLLAAFSIQPLQTFLFLSRFQKILFELFTCIPDTSYSTVSSQNRSEIDQ